MFSDNQKISGRQLNRMLILDIFGVSSLLLPTGLADIAGRDGIFAIAAGTLAGILYLLLLMQIIRNMESDFFAFAKSRCGWFLADVMALFFLLHFLLSTIFLLQLLGELVGGTLLEDSPRWLVMLLMLLICAYAARNGMEERGRAGEVLFWFLGIPLLIMLLLSLGKVSLDNLAPLVVTPFGAVARGGYAVFLCFTVCVVLLFAAPHISKRKQVLTPAVAALAAAGAVNLAIYAILLGVFKVNGLRSQDWPVITLMSIVEFPGNFLRRLDAVMAAVWILSLFALISTMVFYGKYLLRTVTGLKGDRWYLALFCLAAFLGAVWMENFDITYRLYLDYMIYLGAPLLVLIPALVWMVDRVKAGKKGGAGS